MKKTTLFLVSALITISLGITACSSDSSDDSDSVESNSTINTSALENKTVDKGASVSEEVTIDMSSNPMTDEAVASLKEGDDVTKYFTQNTVTAGSSSSRAVSSDEDGLSNFKAELIKITSVSMEVKITASTVSQDCTVLVTAVIPAEETKSKKANITLVTKYDVGEGAGDVETSSLSVKTPKASDLSDKVLKEIDDDDYGSYYQFNSDGKTAKKYEGSSYSVYYDEDYTYDESTGMFIESEDLEDESYEMRKALGELEYLLKSGSDYYIYEGMKLNRTSGSELDSAFTYSMNVSVPYKFTYEDDEGNEKTITAANISAYGKITLTTTSSGTFTGNTYTKAKAVVTNDFKSLLEKMGRSEEDFLESFGTGEYESNYDMVGIYTNDDGIIAVKGSSISVETYPDGTVETDTGDFDNGYALYDGKSIYLVSEKLTEVSALPSIR